MRALLLLYPGGGRPSRPSATSGLAAPDATGALLAYNQSLGRAGVLLAHGWLEPRSCAAYVAFAGGQPTVDSRPILDDSDGLRGYWLLQVKSREEAIIWASRCPAGDGAVIEVRSVEDDSVQSAGRPDLGIA